MPLPNFTFDALSYTAPDGRRLFEDLSLSAGPGRLAVTGRNGTGKSSLLSILAGRLQPTSGSVSVTGRVGLLSQETGDGAGLSVGDLMGVSEGLARLEVSVDFDAPLPYFVYVDKGDEVIAWERSAARHAPIAHFLAFAGGSHRFAHAREALRDFEAARGSGGRPHILVG